MQRAQNQNCPQPQRSSSRKASFGRKQSARSVGSGPAHDYGSVPPLAIALLVCGTRGDVQVRDFFSFHISPSITATYEAWISYLLTDTVWTCLQPFLALGKQLKQHGHRVRLATHAIFKELVESHGLEFYPMGGDPQQLSAYMVSPNIIVQILDQQQSCLHSDKYAFVCAGREQRHHPFSLRLPGYCKPAKAAEGRDLELLACCLCTLT